MPKSSQANGGMADQRRIHPNLRHLIALAWHHTHRFPTLTKTTTGAYCLPLQALQTRKGASSPLPFVSFHLACLADGSLMLDAHLEGERNDTLNNNATAQLCDVVNEAAGFSLFGNNKVSAATVVAQLRDKIPRSCTVRAICDVTHYTSPVLHHLLDGDDLNDIEYSSSEGENTSDSGSNSSSNNTCLSELFRLSTATSECQRVLSFSLGRHRPLCGHLYMNTCRRTSACPN